MFCGASPGGLAQLDGWLRPRSIVRQTTSAPNVHTSANAAFSLEKRAAAVPSPALTRSSRIDERRKPSLSGQSASVYEIEPSQKAAESAMNPEKSSIPSRMSKQKAKLVAQTMDGIAQL